MESENVSAGAKLPLTKQQSKHTPIGKYNCISQMHEFMMFIAASL
jgi:hypothetical protein